MQTLKSAALKLSALSLLAYCLTGTEPAADRPSILFILADDQSPRDLRVYNAESVLETPVESTR